MVHKISTLLRAVKNWLVSRFRRVPMSVLSIIIGLACGGLVWWVLDQVQPRALRSIFTEELQTRLEQQAREPRSKHHIWLMHSALFINDLHEPNFDITDPDHYTDWYFGIDDRIAAG